MDPEQLVAQLTELRTQTVTSDIATDATAASSTARPRPSFDRCCRQSLAQTVGAAVAAARIQHEPIQPWWTRKALVSLRHRRTREMDSCLGTTHRELRRERTSLKQEMSQTEGIRMAALESTSLFFRDTVRRSLSTTRVKAVIRPATSTSAVANLEPNAEKKNASLSCEKRGRECFGHA